MTSRTDGAEAESRLRLTANVAWSDAAIATPSPLRQHQGLPSAVEPRVAERASNAYLLGPKQRLEYTLVCLAAPAWFPLLALIYAVLFIPRRGRVLFTQPRIGQHGRTFEVFKFRTMRTAVTVPLSKPSETPASELLFLGGWLRSTGLDELPQLINVLRGEMHLVGPRPFVRRDLEHLAPDESHERHSVRPGLTGLWQVTRCYDAADIEFLDVDREYLRTASAWLDLCILCWTVSYVLKLRGR